MNEEINLAAPNQQKRGFILRPVNMKTREEYDRIQGIHEWNAQFNTPPVCTSRWTDKDHAAWEASREPLPPFEEWLKLP